MLSLQSLLFRHNFLGNLSHGGIIIQLSRESASELIEGDSTRKCVLVRFCEKEKSQEMALKPVKNCQLKPKYHYWVIFDRYLYFFGFEAAPAPF